VLAQVAIAGLMTVSRQPQALQVATALMLGLMLLAAAALADWAAYRRIRDVVTAGAAGAFLVLCGFPAFASAGLVVGLLPFMACGSRETRARFQAWLLLGGLPLVYAMGVWLLMNRLILGDALFFLRSLDFLVPRLYTFVLAVLSPGLALLPALAVTWGCEKRGTGTGGSGGGPTAASAVLIAFAVALIAGGRVLQAFGVGWNTVSLNVCALAVLMVAMARLRQPVYRLAGALVLFVWLSSSWFGGGSQGSVVAAEGRGGTETCRQVEEYVNERTPYGRVFVLGYAGLDLLRGYAGERLLPNMDLHVGALRRAYLGQNLYVLVPRPEGMRRAESVFWKHPDIYELGGDRLLYAATFGTWRLFEVISAPTQEQLDEWKRAR